MRRDHRRTFHWRRLLFWLLLLVFCVSTFMAVYTLVQRRKENNSFRNLSDLRQQAADTAASALEKQREAAPAAPAAATGEAASASAGGTAAGTSGEETGETPAAPTEPPAEAPTEPGPLPEAQAMLELNPDYFGWITVEDTKVDYPVMYTPDRPQYYLHRAFDGSYSFGGVPYLEEHCDPEGDYLFIQGHHMRDGTMFGQLTEYEERDFWEAHPTFRLDTVYERREYAVIAAFLSEDSVVTYNVFRYYDYDDLGDEATFNEYMALARKYALYDTGVETSFGDEILVLSTCERHTDNGRFALVAKRIK